MIAPAVGQLMLLAMMAVEGRWTFAGLIIPGFIGCVASALAMLLSQRHAPDYGHPAADSPDSPASAAASQSREDSADHHAAEIPTADLESLLGLNTATATDVWRGIVRRWHDADDASSCWTVPIGMTDRERYDVDLPGSGPHALVAGTTGSGKSVLLESWCLSMACRVPPNRLNFVFLDFKGGSAFRVLHRLPHTVGFVSDLDISHAVRALRVIETELKRREHLAAARHAASVDELEDPPARLMVVIDEFHALRNQLPDYMDRLVSLASLGRSLGMHLVVCTQNPMGQVTTDMKANIGLNICLRVRDPLQSAELIGDSRAALISPQQPGVAYSFDGERRVRFRCASPRRAEALVTGCARATRFLGLEPPPPLFSAPLPRTLPPDRAPVVRIASGTPEALCIGLEDTGVRLSPCLLPLDQGNIAVVGADGRGKSTLLGVIADRLARSGLPFRATGRTPSGPFDRPAPDVRNTEPSVGSRETTSQGPVSQGSVSPGRIRRRFWLVDDADALIDPLSTGNCADEFRSALRDPHHVVVFSLGSCRHLRFPEHCGVRIIFPTGDRAIDMMAGIPMTILASLTDTDIATAGRAVLLSRGRSMIIQCVRGEPIWRIQHLKA
ncbi:cell division protein FtsK [Bifidobacterium simiarum]|uniref:Cell division protein FtsK n=2 Tax=Bifidobacterium simiarum TaxID=2045441 RepID=A0A2M9HE50_9BIFI|nr:cell division protein FtsK [Bifidobacterium simiarum]